MQKIVIIGAGFAGVQSALSAKRYLKLNKHEGEVGVVLVSPEPSLVIRPRLYEANAAAMKYPLTDLLKEANIQYVQGRVDSINDADDSIMVRDTSGSVSTVTYDRLILAAGSVLVRPEAVTGLDKHTFDIDTLESASRLEQHVHKLATLPQSNARDTLVVCGAGFTGVELATELPGRLQAAGSSARVILIDNSTELAKPLGPNPRPIISEALQKLGVEVKLGSGVKSVDASGVTLTSGERIDTLTAIWTAGIRATPLTQQIPGEKDALGRLFVEPDLRVLSSRNIFATGDAAHAMTDNQGHVALMSCQHARILGCFSGHNAAADLLNEATETYSQPTYNSCLDLGGHGAVITAGWDRQVMVSGDVAKQVKTFINQKLIYPPQSVEDALEGASIVQPSANEMLKSMLAGKI